MHEAIALGLGDNVDYEIIWDSQVIEGLIDHYGITAAQISALPVVTTERELVISILSFMRSGAGGERFITSSAVIEQFAGRFARKVTLGGTSVRAAIAMRKLGYRSALHLVTINDHVRSLIPQDSPYVCSNPVDTLFPHLIVQFDRAARVQAGDIAITARRANRIIYHNDTDNVTMRLNEEFAGLITAARVFLVSGFNAMQSEELLVDRLAALQRIMAALPGDAQVFFEDAAFYNPRFSQIVLDALASQIGIYSLNEDELQAHIGRAVDLLDVEQVAAALADLHAVIPIPTIVVHSMHWALAYGDNALRFARALKGGVTMATTRFRYGDDFTAAEYHAIEGLAAGAEETRFATALQQHLPGRLCCVPVAQVEQSNGTTIGLGDAFVGGFLPAVI